MNTEKIKILILLLLSSTIQAQVGINTTLSGNVSGSVSNTTTTRTLEVNGGLRIGKIYPALTTITTVVEAKTVTTELPLDIEDYDKVLVADPEGNIDHINTKDFYAFSTEYAKYKTVTATYYYTDDYYAQHEEVIKESIISIGWIDFCIQYIDDAGKWIELKYKPNKRNRTKNSKGEYIKNSEGEYLYDDFVMTATVTHNSLTAFRQYTEMKKDITSANNPWYFFTSGAGGVYFNRIGRKSTDLGTKRLAIGFFKENLEECFLMDVLITTHRPSGVDKDPYVSIVIWYSSPKFYHKN